MQNIIAFETIYPLLAYRRLMWAGMLFELLVFRPNLGAVSATQPTTHQDHGADFPEDRVDVGQAHTVAALWDKLKSKLS